MKKISSRFVLPIVVALVAGVSGWMASEWIAPGQLTAAKDVYAGIDAYNSGRYRSAFWTFDRLAKQGDPLAQRLLARMYSRGHYVEESEQAAVAWWTRAAEQGNLRSMNALGSYYANAEPRNYERAARWFGQSAAGGNGFGQAMTGYMYLNGYGVDRDVELGRHWLERAVAESQVSAARLFLGEAYRDGTFGDPDPELAVHWCIEAAKLGNAEAMNCAIHLMVDDEDSLAVDYETAFLWAILIEHWTELLGLWPQRYREYVLHGFRLPDTLPDLFPEPGSVSSVQGEREFETPRLDAAGQARAQLRADAILSCWPEPPIGLDSSIEECLQRHGAPAL